MTSTTQRTLGVLFLVLALIAMPLPLTAAPYAAIAAAPTTTTTAHAFNGSVTVTHTDGSTTSAGVAIAGNETLTHSASGALLSGELKFTATINGKTFTGTATARLSTGRFYSGSYTCPETGVKVKFYLLVGHPEGSVGGATVTIPTGVSPHGFGFGRGSFSSASLSSSGSGPSGIFTGN